MEEICDVCGLPLDEKNVSRCRLCGGNFIWHGQSMPRYKTAGKFGSIRHPAAWHSLQYLYCWKPRA